MLPGKHKESLYYQIKHKVLAWCTATAVQNIYKSNSKSTFSKTKDQLAACSEKSLWDTLVNHFIIFRCEILCQLVFHF